MHSKDYEEIFMKYESFRIKKFITMYISPAILIVGTTGNIIAFFILRRNMFRISTYFYLAVLAIADLIVLQFGLLREWIGHISDYDIQNISNLSCKIFVSLNYLGSDFSVWLIVAVTTERFIAVCFPLRANVLCSVNKARSVTISLLGLSFCLNAHFLWTVELTEVRLNSSKVEKCTPGHKFDFFLTEVWPLVDAFTYSFIPTFICSVLNILIIRRVFIARKYRGRLQKCNAGRNNLNNKSLPSERTIKLTKMLLAVSLTFVLTTLPNSICIVVQNYWDLDYTKDVLRQISNFVLARTITGHLMYINHSVNFFLYCATGKKFRKNMDRALCKLRRTSNRSLSDSNIPHLMSRVSYTTGRLSVNLVVYDSKLLHRRTTRL
ncbi:thyrotropin-releasing hormone receptor-like [Saccostrea echinata]|uniref:thyrotropin-releasing hormone receptor-like n=1 Tax=Saccostrea echinata TaxID=191078 RepID=UPI002A7EC5D5|nr:thyrotropin-releasing hormone receptor-like [Saccostrea echinata]